MRKVLVILGIVAAVCLTFGYGRIPSLLQADAQDDLPTHRVERTTLTESAVALGTIKAKVGAEVKVGSRLSGVVAELRVNVGDRVAEGETLATLHDEEWRARADLLAAELAAAIANLEYAESDLARMERLSDLVPETDVDDSRRNLRVLRQQVEAARARRNEARIQLGYTVIRAPVSGTIASISTYEGETVAASFSAPTFVTILDLSRLEVQAYVDETDIGRVHEGQAVTFRVDAFPGHELSGVVQAIYPKAQMVNNVVNYVVIIDILDQQGLLIRPEMTAHVNFILEQREDTVTVPRAALLRERGQDLVIVREGEQWVERPVETGLQTPQRIEIVSGLEKGDVIVADKEAWKRRLEAGR